MLVIHFNKVCPYSCVRLSVRSSEKSHFKFWTVNINTTPTVTLQNTWRWHWNVVFIAIVLFPMLNPSQSNKGHRFRSISNSSVIYTLNIFRFKWLSKVKVHYFWHLVTSRKLLNLTYTMFAVNNSRHQLKLYENKQGLGDSCFIKVTCIVSREIKTTVTNV